MYDINVQVNILLNTQFHFKFQLLQFHYFKIILKNIPVNINNTRFKIIK